MPVAEYVVAFLLLKPLLARYAERLCVKVDTPNEYTVITRTASPFPQHKGQPMFFGSVRLGKACVSLHLMPLYMCSMLTDSISPALRKRMQGKTCFNFRTAPSPELMTELANLTEMAFKQWGDKGWL